MRFDNERTFGVEIEFRGNRAEVVRILGAFGINIRSESYNHNTRDYWKIVPDMSCEWELVSPPLMGRNGLLELAVVSDALAETYASVDSSCGFHVHHNASDLNTHEIRAVMTLYANYEPVIDMLLPKSRRGDSNGYCKSLLEPVNWKQERRESITRLIGNIIKVIVKNNRMRNGYGGRYYKVNLESYNKYGTIEFRQHSGTLNFDKMRSWIVFTQSIINWAKDKHGHLKPSKHCSWHMLKETIECYGKEIEDLVSKSAIAYLNQRFKEFSAGRYRFRDDIPFWFE